MSLTYGTFEGHEAIKQLPAKRVLFDGSPHAVQRIGERFDNELLDFLASAGGPAR